MALKKSDLYSSIWASCDELRGGMDASQYKDYVLFMLFIKYVSDKYVNYDGFPPIEIPAGASFQDMVALKGDSNIGDKINKQIIQPLIDNNPQLARSDFPDFNDPNKLGDGAVRVQRLGNLIAIFENPALNFSKNQAEHDDILGDAYEYLMRHFATQSGKSKGQFYTPAEVSRVIAKVIGISPQNSKASTTVYDPTCGSGSLLLKVAAEAGKEITLEGQEKDSTTAGLARMNMILHGFPTAKIASGGEGTLVKPRFLKGEQLNTYDYVVANPPFSDKSWSTGMILGESGRGDPYQRFTWGVPPYKQGDYAYLLHIIRSMNSTGKAACILPHGVLFRGNAEAVIRRQLVRSGILKAIIGLPANLFYGTGIPACILVLDRENAPGRRGIFMIDASKGFRKDGPKNRLREQDIHKIVDIFRRQDESDPRYARLVSFDEIADPKNDYNLNLPRYIDNSEPEDEQDIEAHMRGGIPVRDVCALDKYWAVMPNLRPALFTPPLPGRPNYVQLALPLAEIKPTILNHPEFHHFHQQVLHCFEEWLKSNVTLLKEFDVRLDDKTTHLSKPKQLIGLISESLLTTFRDVPLVSAYDMYQHLMDYWDETMQDDAYLITSMGWQAAAQPRELQQIKNKEGKLVWSEKEDFKQGKRRFKSDLIPADLLINRYFAAEQENINRLEAELAALEQQLEELQEEHGGEEGLLADVLEGEGEKQKITAKGLKARLKLIASNPEYEEEATLLQMYVGVLEQQTTVKGQLKEAQETLETKLYGQYPQLTVAEIKELVVLDKWLGKLKELAAAEKKLDQKVSQKYANLTTAQQKELVVDDKWLGALASAVKGELDRVSQTLTGRVRQLAERYATPLPQLTAEVTVLTGRVEAHLYKMGVTWP